MTPEISFEFFPPSDAAAEQSLWAAVQRLAPLAPRFVSITYGADGSTRDRTQRCVERLSSDTALTVAPHLTCVRASREHIHRIAADYWQRGVRHIVALRGDAPQDAGITGEHAGDFRYASELVASLREVAPFQISVAAFPEGHPENPGIDADIDNLKRKCEAGAARAITQFFFDTDIYLRYRDRAAARGVRAPIVPGILPITRFPQLRRFAERCGATIPDWLQERFSGLDDDPETRQLIAAHVAIEQVERLRRHGVQEFHFYTLNRAELTYAICYALGLRPRARRQAA